MTTTRNWSYHIQSESSHMFKNPRKCVFLNKNSTFRKKEASFDMRCCEKKKCDVEKHIIPAPSGAGGIFISQNGCIHISRSVRTYWFERTGTGPSGPVPMRTCWSVRTNMYLKRPAPGPSGPGAGHTYIYPHVYPHLRCGYTCNTEKSDSYIYWSWRTSKYITIPY